MTEPQSDRLPFRVTICGIEELAEHCAIGVTHVLSILDPTAPEPPAFGAFGEHERLELRFDDVIEERPDAAAPQRHHVAQLLDLGRTLPAAGEAHLLVHCHAGISRSTAATTLILAQARPEIPATLILARIRGIRDKAWPNLRMIEFGEDLLGRSGEFSDAVGAVYLAQLQRRPQLAPYFLAAGRQKELDKAREAGWSGEGASAG
jgi:predicted protein tyrosine phosphatase